jgi:hypothetical protein
MKIRLGAIELILYRFLRIVDDPLIGRIATDNSNTDESHDKDYSCSIIVNYRSPPCFVTALNC